MVINHYIHMYLFNIIINYSNLAIRIVNTKVLTNPWVTLILRITLTYEKCIIYYATKYYLSLYL